MIVSRFCPVKEIGIFFYFFFNWHPKICFPSCYLFQWLTFTVQIDLCAKFHTQRLFHMDVLRRRSGFFQNGQGLIQKCLLKVLSKHTSVDTTLSQPLTFETCFSLPAFFPPSRPLFSVLQYFVWPEWYSILREVEAGALASRNTTLRFRAFPINTMEKSCVPCVATIIAIAWPPQCVTCSLFAPEVRLPGHSRFICCLLTSMAELEISRA